jgi:hypothetical protein
MSDNVLALRRGARAAGASLRTRAPCPPAKVAVAKPIFHPAAGRRKPPSSERLLADGQCTWWPSEYAIETTMLSDGLRPSAANRRRQPDPHEVACK